MGSIACKVQSNAKSAEPFVVFNTFNDYLGCQLPKPSLRSGFVYIVKQTNAQNIYKIGCTNNVTRRLISMRTDNMFAELFASIQSDDCFRLEKELHTRFKEYRIQGEWFCIPDALLAKLVYLKPIGQFEWSIASPAQNSALKEALNGSE